MREFRKFIYISDITSYLSIDFKSDSSNPMYYADKLYIDNKRATNIEIPYGVTKIPVYAFAGCDSLTSITIPNSVTSIEKGAFSKCSSLTSITIPNSVTSIGYAAFENCTSMTSLIIPDNVTSMASFAFVGCSGLTSLNCNTTKVPSNLFGLNENNIKLIILGDNVTSIDKDAFAGCKELRKVFIPKSVIEIEMAAFEDCINLTDIEYSGTQSEWEEIYIGTHNENLKNANIKYNASIETIEPIVTPKPTIEPDNDYPYEINNLSLKTLSGENLSNAPINIGFIVNVDFTKLQKHTETDYIFIAVYDKNDTLLSLNYIQANFAENYGYNVGLYVPPQNVEIGSIKTFIWNTFNSSVPLAKSKEL